MLWICYYINIGHMQYNIYIYIKQYSWPSVYSLTFPYWHENTRCLYLPINCIFIDFVLSFSERRCLGWFWHEHGPSMAKRIYGQKRRCLHTRRRYPDESSRFSAQLREKTHFNIQDNMCNTRPRYWWQKPVLVASLPFFPLSFFVCSFSKDSIR